MRIPPALLVSSGELQKQLDYSQEEQCLNLFLSISVFFFSTNCKQVKLSILFWQWFFSVFCEVCMRYGNGVAFVTKNLSCFIFLLAPAATFQNKGFGKVLRCYYCHALRREGGGTSVRRWHNSGGTSVSRWHFSSVGLVAHHWGGGLTLVLTWLHSDRVVFMLLCMIGQYPNNWSRI